MNAGYSSFKDSTSDDRSTGILHGSLPSGILLYCETLCVDIADKLNMEIGRRRFTCRGVDLRCAVTNHGSSSFGCPGAAAAAASVSTFEKIERDQHATPDADSTRASARKLRSVPRRRSPSSPASSPAPTHQLTNPIHRRRHALRAPSNTPP
jgi:hypothetical protein